MDDDGSYSFFMDLCEERLEPIRGTPMQKHFAYVEIFNIGKEKNFVWARYPRTYNYICLTIIPAIRRKAANELNVAGVPIDANTATEAQLQKLSETSRRYVQCFGVGNTLRPKGSWLARPNVARAVRRSLEPGPSNTQPTIQQCPAGGISANLAITNAVNTAMSPIVRRFDELLNRFEESNQLLRNSIESINESNQLLRNTIEGNDMNIDEIANLDN